MATSKKAASVKRASTSKKTVSSKTTKSSVTVAAPASTKTPSFAESIGKLSFWRSLAAELIGTFLIASVFIVGQGQPLYILFAFVGIVLVFGTLSGAYVNPALTAAAWITRRISWIRAIGYIVAEIVGALLALLVINAFVGGGADSANAALGTSAPAIFKAAALPVASKDWYVFFSELLGTAILGFAFANALREKQERLTAAFTAGLGIFVALMVAFIAASYVGATAIINPAVAFSLQGVSWSMWPIAVYILAPVIGAAVGFFINDFLKGRATK